MAIEHERRWLVDFQEKSLPEYSLHDITQVYLISDPGTTTRVRKDVCGTSRMYSLTKKRKIAVDKAEEETQLISVADFINLLLSSQHPSCRPIYKTRYVIRDDDLTWELDHFWELDMVILELENPPDNVQLPSWVTLIKEVTDDPRYSNRSLAEHGNPDSNITF